MLKHKQRRKQTPATISQITKCIKNNQHNVKILLETNPLFEQSTEFIVFRDPSVVNIETSILSKQVNEDKHTLVYKLNEVIDIPKKLNENFDNSLDNQYYIYGVPKENSFFYSLLYIISKEFKLKDSGVRDNYVVNLKETLVKSIPSLFRKNKYSKYGYKLSNILDNVTNNDLVNEGLMCALSDNFNINLIVLNYDSEKYWVGKEYNNSINEKNVIIIYSNGVYMPLIHIYGEHPDNFIYKCIVNRYSIYNKLPSDAVSVVDTELKTSGSNSNKTIKKASIDHDEIELQLAMFQSKSHFGKTETETETEPEPGIPVLLNKHKLRGFSSYKLAELQQLCGEYNISTSSDVNGNSKNKTKRVLYDDLLAL